ncbi:MAG TPA: hypothetical protein PK668_21600 [Myxococcota bacterium]|nr:hypothetical protein [Myxococcota bacterium]HRY96074.1 hypothetical protein [Myxococcota bacterium]
MSRVTPAALLLALAALLTACDGKVSAPDAGGHEEVDAAAPDGDDGGAGTDEGGDADPPACAALETFETGLTPGAVLHVATWGSDADGDGSAERPYASIARAAQGIGPGTAVHVHSGTYPGGVYLADLAGEAGAPIWIGGAPGEPRPVLEGGGGGVQLVRVRYLVLHDLEVRDASQNGVNCDDGGERDDPEATGQVIFRGLHIHDIGGGGNEDCLKLSGVRDYFVLDSEFARCGGGMSGSGIDHVGCHHGLIARCRFEQMSGNAVQSKGGSADIEIRQCWMVDAGERAVNMGGSTGFEFFRPPLSSEQPNAEARDIRVIANVMIGSSAPIAFVGCVGCLAANNTLVDPDTWILRVLQETTSTAEYEFLPTRDCVFANNLVFFDRGALSTQVNVGPDTAAETFTFSSNLWYAHDDPGRSEPDALPAAETAPIIGQDPGLADPAAADYHIGPGSPAAGRGTPWPAVRVDADGRCFASPPSIGAYEVQD